MRTLHNALDVAKPLAHLCGLRVILFLLSLGLWLFPLQSSTAQDARELPSEYYHDFRDRPLPADWQSFPANKDKFFQFEPQGLRISLAKTYLHPGGGVGVKTSALIRGDFEITATVEVLHIEAPPKGPGAGVGLSLDAPTRSAQLRRVIGAKGKHTILRTGYNKAPDMKSLDWKEKRAPCAAKLLRMRLKRTGTTLVYSWAAGVAGDSFVEVDEQEFGNDDMAHVRLFAMNGQQPCRVDVRLIDVRIRSGSQAGGLLPNAQATDTTGMLTPLLIGMVTAAALAMSVWFYVRQRRRNDAAPLSGSSDQAEAAATLVSLSVQCFGCRKTLKVRPESAGKRVKCAHCGTTLLIPGSEASDALGAS